VNDPELSELEAEICAVAAAMATSRSRLLRLVGEFDAAKGWEASGQLSCAHWLAGRIDIELSTAREQVRVARALRELPETMARFEAGELSYAKVRQLTRVATAENEAELLALAAQHPAGQLGRVLARWLERKDPAAAEERRREARGVSFGDEPNGNGAVIAQLPRASMAVLRALIDAEVANAPAGASERSASLRQRRADAFVRLIDRMAGLDAPAGASGKARVLRPELVLHRRLGETSLSDGTVLPKIAAREFSCDCDIRVMTHLPDGSPADVSRRYRVVPPPLRMLVLERDGYQCTFPGCRAQHYLEVHHIIHWEDGGETALVNLITFCSYHHTFVHERGWPAGLEKPTLRLVAA
jgi:hypothetical protein